MAFQDCTLGNNERMMDRLGLCAAERCQSPQLGVPIPFLEFDDAPRSFGLGLLSVMVKVDKKLVTANGDAGRRLV